MQRYRTEHQKIEELRELLENLAEKMEREMKNIEARSALVEDTAEKLEAEMKMIELKEKRLKEQEEVIRIWPNSLSVLLPSLFRVAYYNTY